MQCLQSLLRFKPKGTICISPGEVGIQQNVLCGRNDAFLDGPTEKMTVSIIISQWSTSVPWAVEIKRLYKTTEGTEI